MEGPTEVAHRFLHADHFGVLTGEGAGDLLPSSEAFPPGGADQLDQFLIAVGATGPTGALSFELCQCEDSEHGDWGPKGLVCASRGKQTSRFVKDCRK